MSEGLDVAECLASCFKARSRNPAREEARGATQSRLYEAREREREREPVRKRESEIFIQIKIKIFSKTYQDFIHKEIILICIKVYRCLTYKMF